MSSSTFNLASTNPQSIPTSTISEDTLHYTIHLPSSSTSPETWATLITGQVNETLLAYSPSSSKSGAGSGWVWHKDEWELKVIPQEDLQDRRFSHGSKVSKVKFQDEKEDLESESPYAQQSSTSATSMQKGRKLEGRMRIGDSVEDEWLVVYLLRMVSQKWPELLISIKDTDGDFLLIEAADHLPRWVTPTNAENRLWLAAGQLHLIPLDHRSPLSTRPKNFEFNESYDQEEGMEGDDDHSWLSETDATRILRRSLSTSGGQTSTFHAKEIEKDVWARISSYPQALKTVHQKTHAYLPLNIARALSFQPSLAQRAVEGFYTRDPAQLRAAVRGTKFPPSPSGNIVKAPLVLTRTAYAQLKGQVYHPPRIFGSEWRPVVTDSVSGEEREKQERERNARDLGVKMIIGFEIMYKEDNRRSRTGGDEEDDSYLDRDEEYQTYLRSLRKAGWFGDQIEGSAGYKEREKEGRAAWKGLKGDGLEDRISFAQAVNNALSLTANLTASDLTAPSDWQGDSEAWLQVSPDELDGMLSQAEAGREVPVPRPKESGIDGEEKQANEQADALGVLAKKVNSFVEAKGDLEGARFEDEVSDDDMLGDSDDESDMDDAMEDDEPTQEEKDQRLSVLVPGLAPEEWGSKTQTSKSEPAEEEEEIEEISTKPKVSFAEGTKDEPKPAAPAEMKVRPPIFEPEEYDGHVAESDDDMDEYDPGADTMSWGAKAIPKTSNKPQKKRTVDPSVYALQEALRTGKPIPTDKLKEFRLGGQGDISDDEDGDDDDEQGEEMGGPDMDAEEEEFLNFAREALGINDDMWKGMLSDRKARGAYVPDDSGKPSTSTLASNAPAPASASVDEIPELSSTPLKPVIPGQRNENLDSFERVMDAMEAELAKNRAPPKPTSGKSKPNFKPPPKTKSKQNSAAASNPLPKLPTEADLEALDEDDLIAMDRELRAALKSAGIEDDDDSDVEMDMDAETREAIKGLGDDEKGEYKMMRDLMGSYKAQAGGSGVVGNLFGRLNGSK